MIIKDAKAYWDYEGDKMLASIHKMEARIGCELKHCRSYFSFCRLVSMAMARRRETLPTTEATGR